MKIALYGKEFSEDFRENIHEMFEQFRENNAKVFIHDRFKAILECEKLDHFNFSGSFNDNSGLPDGVDVLISLGGDGTFLNTLNLVKDSQVPVLGINTGRLGFLANISREELKDSIGQLLRGEFSTETRNLISLNSNKGPLDPFNTALNEITILKKGVPMISIETHLNGEYLNSYWADGLIISTPTGSTAYSMAVGGPIMLPGSRNFIISPVSPHNLTVRPIVVPDDMEIRLQIHSRSDQFMVAMDSRSYTVDTNTELIITKASYGIQMVKFPVNNFYNTLRNKLMWGMDKRN